MICAGLAGREGSEISGALRGSPSGTGDLLTALFAAAPALASVPDPRQSALEPGHAAARPCRCNAAAAMATRIAPTT